MTAGLNAVKSKKVIEWNENLLHCFNMVKTMFARAPCRASPDFSVNSKPFILTIDFLSGCWGCVVSGTTWERTVFRC